ncbi:MAG: hypothetical protein ABIE47_03475 [Pseudomonadota bacterium]
MSKIERKHIKFCVAGMCFSVSVDQPINSIRSDKTYEKFLCSAKPEVTIHAQYAGVPEIPLRDEDLIFDSQAAWSLYRVDGLNIFVQKDLVPSPTSPYLMAILDPSFRKGEVHSLIRESEKSPIDGLVPHPLDYPLGEVLMICLLAQGRGLMVQACGIDNGGCGHLFLGNSSHGKSTIAKLWFESGATVLNDDRIIVRERDGQFWMYGTPWHGTFNKVSPKGLPIHKIFFLRHGEKNSAVPKNGAEAVSMLLTRAFPPLWDQKGMEYTLGLLDRMASKLPCYDLNFLPDKNIIDFVRNI